MKIAEQIVLTALKDENDAFHRAAFDVNMRLFKSSEGYREVILAAVNYLEKHLKCVFEDYTNIRGVAASKLGIPWNIIAYKDSVNTIRICINPKIVDKSINTTPGQTSCPSMGDQKYPIERFLSFDLQFYDINGHEVIQHTIGRQDGGFIIQHELLHNLGICPGDNL